MCKKFMLSQMSRPALGPIQFPIPWVLGFFPGCKVVRHEVNNLPLSRVSGAIPLLPNCVFMVFRGETSCILYVQFMIAGIGSMQLAIMAGKFQISCLIFLYSFVVSASLPGQKTDITQPNSVYVLIAYEMFPYGVSPY
jgi:hypothetical protein